MPSLIGRRPDYARVAAYEREQARLDVPDYARNVAIVNALAAEARALGVWPPSDPLAGIDVDIRVARAFNVRIPPC